MIEYTVIRSNRKTVSLQIDENCNLIVRAPLKLSDKKIREVVQKNSQWIEDALERQRKKQDNKVDLTQADIAILKDMANNVLSAKVKYFAEIMNVEYGNVKITSAQKRFGSCSGRNDICFSYILMLYPQKAIDYVVIHELAHTVHHNHSRDFYNFVAQFMPDYKQAEKLLKGKQKLPY